MFYVLQHLEQPMRFVKMCVNLCDKTTVHGNSTRFTKERKKEECLFTWNADYSQDDGKQQTGGEIAKKDDCAASTQTGRQKCGLESNLESK